MFESHTKPFSSSFKKEAYNFVLSKINEIKNPSLKKWCLEIVENEKFRICPASKEKHQCFEGGLVVHNAEVLEIAHNIAKSKSLTLDLDIITTSIIFHDCGKIYEYCKKDTGEYEYTLHNKLIRHLSRSYAIFMSHNDPENVSEELKMQIGHCILSHHGRQEWGSVVTPLTPEAYVIHCADWMSANCTNTVVGIRL